MTNFVGHHITILGAGATGTLLASILAQNGQQPTLWGRRPELMQALAEKRENITYLPGVPIPPQVRLTADEAMACAAGELIICAVPTQFIRTTLVRLVRHIPPGVPIISVAKGIENTTLLRPTEIITEICGLRRVVALAGPAIAGEIAAGLPTTIVAATTDSVLAKWTQQLLSTAYFRIYTNNDVIGVELAGATKNVIAVAAGILDGMHAGVNAKASLLTRGLVEMSRLGVTMGAHPLTFNGLAGLGDLVTTCFSPGSRNRSFGQWIGQGLSHQEALAKMSGVVEGIATTRSVVELARRREVDMPITQCLYAVLFEGKSPAAGIADLMSRRPRDERSASDRY